VNWRISEILYRRGCGIQRQGKGEVPERKEQDLLKTERGLSSLPGFSKSEIENLFKAIVERHGVKLGALAQPVRVAMTGGRRVRAFMKC